MRFTQFLINEHQLLESDFETKYDQALTKAADLIIDNCQPFLRSINNKVDKNRLYRGYDNPSKDEGKFERGLMIKKKVRKKREPVDTPGSIHRIMNTLFVENFGIPFRSSALFTTGRVEQANHYGKEYLVFPIGDFEFLWSKADSDMFEGTLYHLIERAYDDDGIQYEIKELQSDLVDEQAEYKSIQQELKKEMKKKNRNAGVIEDLEDKLADVEEEIRHSQHEIEIHQQRLKTTLTEIDTHMKKYLSQKNLPQAIKSGHEIMIATNYYYMVPDVRPTRHDDGDMIETGDDLIKKLQQRLKAKR